MPNGTLDPKFGTGGVVETDFGALTSEAHSVAIDRAGKIVAAGVAQDVSGGLHAAIARYDRRGRLDPTFGSGGEVTTPASFDPFDLAIDSLGRIIVVGAGSPEYGLVRYDASGALDPSFGSGGTVNSELGLSALALTPSNAIIAAGAAASFPSPPTPYRKFALARYSSGGSLDPTFGSGGEVATDFGRGGEGASADDVAIDPSGRIVAAGVFTVNGLVGDTRLALARYNPSGSLDTTFGSGGLVTTAFPPETEIFKAEIAASRGRATFFYTALGNDASWLFQCALLSRPTSKPKFRNCGGSKRYSHLKPGRYTFEVRAVGVAGPDPTPAKRRFRIR
jgi:uncharacterized delta-60 repeat protein